MQIALTFLLSANNQRHEVYHPSLNRSILAVVDEKKLWHTKLCTGLQGFVLLWSGTCFYDKKLAQEDKKSPCANALLQVTNTI
ncbi:hypothetical protein D7V59_18005 [Escherichia coli]|nr:hypothetical protein [Escherichia coli]